MSLPEYYLITTKNLEAFFNSLINAQPPQKFTLKFLEQLEFKSTNDRLLIGMLKGLKFIDANGIPQERYFQFIDQTQSKKVLAEAIKESYSDLFAVNIRANEFSEAEIRNKLKTLYHGSKSDNVLRLVANTFHGLCKYADFSAQHGKPTIITKKNEEPDIEDLGRSNSTNGNTGITQELIKKVINTEMHYNIQIHLPETRDITVYDAIFKSLKEHLL